MKRKLLFPVMLIVLSVFAFSSCNDSNDDLGEGGGAKPEVPVPATTLEAAALANAVYGPLQTLSSSYSFLIESATEATISFEEADDTKDGPQVSILELEKSNWYPIKIFNRLYTSIVAANTAIEGIGAAPVSDQLKQSDKDLLIARAQFIRGYNYFQLVQLFGEIPLIVRTDATDTEKETRKSVDEVYAQIVSDLNVAIPNLPEWEAKKSDPSQLAAKTILAKVYLTWGQKPLTQDEVEAIKYGKADPVKPAVDTEKLQKAKEYADAVINSGKYTLLPDFNNIWGVRNENNAEVIFSIYHEGDGIDIQGNHQTHCGYTWPKFPRTDPHISYADISYENALPDGDARKPYSYTTRVEHIDGTIDTLTWPLSIVRPGKWIHRTTTGLSEETQPNDIDHIDFRFGEVYLIKAEAQFFLGSEDKGLAAINTLRARAHVPALTAVALQDLYNEWGYELAFEQKHWLNLVRWRTLLSSFNKIKSFEYYKDAYNNQAAFEALPGADKTRFAFYARIYKHLHAKIKNIDGHYYRFPIPLSESYNELGVVGQNPGY
ncbi:SusD family protein [Bacteroidales bacterium Barb6]|nr:SusD family protein [Bacteroidales bacterium Barb6]